MAWQKRSIQLILGLPLALPIVSYAVEVGDTVVQSGQNQPLNASINVTDIDPATFSVKLANPEMYKQLGLSADQPISAKFQPTGKNSGKILLTTTQPIAAPFTDVVLDVQNKGEKKVVPKTLLMPLGNEPQSQAVSTPNEASTTPSKVHIAPTSPIALPETSRVDSNQPVDNPSIAQPVTTQKATTKTAASIEPAVVSATTSPSTIPSGGITYQSDNLVIQETKRPVGAGDTSNTASNSIANPTDNTATTPSAEKPAVQKSAGKASRHGKAKSTAVSSAAESETATTNGSVTYVIHRNENLWSIASKIAKSNKTDVHTVMKQIVDNNPDSFEGGDPNKIIANTKLDLPKYEVMPSQLGIKNAKQARQHAGKARKINHKTAVVHPVTPPVKTVQKYHAKKPLQPHHTQYHKTRTLYKAPAPVTQTAPHKSHMAIVAPPQSSGSAQGSHNAVSNGNKNVAPQIISQLQQKRQATAAQAARVNQLNTSISSSEQKIKIQNQKLAQLEERLKELNKK